MRVLLWAPGGNCVPGGHGIEHLQTAKHLNTLGVNVQLSYAEQPRLDSYDLVHGFGLGPMEMRLCRQQRIPVALSTIYWNRDYTTGQHDTGQFLQTWKHRTRTGLILLRSALQGRHIQKCEAYTQHLQTTRVAYEMADLLLPNSELEAQMIRSDLGATTPYHVVPNAAPATFMRSAKADIAERHHVLYAGRFEPHKNQLGLIEAMRGSNIPVVLVGPPHPDHAAYYAQCKIRATNNITILPGVPHEELAPLYCKARVHVLPSWLETTGLVSLEAALCGCNIVTRSGLYPEYFRDMAWYCDPANHKLLPMQSRLLFMRPIVLICANIFSAITLGNIRQKQLGKLMTGF